MRENPDAELLRLGTQFDAIRAGELRAWDAVEAAGLHPDDSPEGQAAYALADLAYDLAEQVIMPMRATTLEGVLVKQRVISWQHGGNPVTAERIADHPDLATEMIAAILADLDAMSSTRTAC